jgi:hypothetical protein
LCLGKSQIGAPSHFCGRPFCFHPVTFGWLTPFSNIEKTNVIETSRGSLMNPTGIIR